LHAAQNCIHYRTCGNMWAFFHFHKLI
jgi:hypothetical protein